jgi:hypothetical protein
MNVAPRIRMPRLPGRSLQTKLARLLIGEDLEVLGVSDLLAGVNIDPDCHLTIVAALAAAFARSRAVSRAGI